MKWTWFFKAFQVMGIVSNWSVKAMADGKVTLQEAFDLVQELGHVLGFKVEIDLPEH